MLELNLSELQSRDSGLEPGPCEEQSQAFLRVELAPSEERSLASELQSQASRR